MAKYKLGLFISNKNKSKQGKMEVEVREELYEKLNQEKEWEIFDNLDFNQATIKNGKVYIDDFCLSDLDVYFWFAKGARKKGLYNFEILKALSQEVKVINNPDSYFNGFDKLNSNIILKKNNISSPDFAYLSKNSIEEGYKILKEWQELILKPRNGAYGVGILRIKDKETLRDVLGYIDSSKGYYFERFIENDMSKWCGITVVNNKVLFGYRKTGSKISDWKVFDRDRKGGEVEYVEPSEEQKDLALRAAQAFKLDITGVDIITSKDNKLYVVDVHTLPGFFPNLCKKSGISASEEILNCIKNA